jgi:hypothetical protein
MVLHSAQYKRQDDEDATFEDIMDTTIHTSANNHTNVPQRSGSIINSNSISLGNNTNNRVITQPSTEVDLSARVDTPNNDDNLSFGSDRLCTAPEGHVRFVNSTIRYHMAGPGFW